MRKLAIGAAAALPALALAAGSASAQPEPAEAGIAQQPDVVLNEIAVDLAPSGGGFIELHNPTDDHVVLQGYELSTCSATGPLDMVFDAFGPTDVISAGGFFTIAELRFADFGGDADIIVDDLGLDQSAGGVRLEDTSTGLRHEVKWGNPHPDCSGFPEAGVSPDGDNSLQRNTIPPPTWCALPPTPGAANGSC